MFSIRFSTDINLFILVICVQRRLIEVMYMAYNAVLLFFLDVQHVTCLTASKQLSSIQFLNIYINAIKRNLHKKKLIEIIYYSAYMLPLVDAHCFRQHLYYYLFNSVS